MLDDPSERIKSDAFVCYTAWIIGVGGSCVIPIHNRRTTKLKLFPRIRDNAHVGVYRNEGEQEQASKVKVD